MNTYPPKLLSRAQYRKIKIDSLIGKGFLLVRRPVPNEDLTDPDTGQLNAEAICEFALDKNGRFECFGLSVNLYGVFKFTDLAYILLSPSYKDYWEEGDAEVSIESLNYNEVEVKSAFIIALDGLSGDVFSYQDKNRNKRKNDDEWTLLHGKEKAIAEYKNRMLKGWYKLEHKPLKGNFWHFEWNFYEEDGNLINSKFKDFKIAIAENTVQSTLKHHTRVYGGEDYDLPAEIYLSV